MVEASLSGLPNPLRKPSLASFQYQEFLCGSETLELQASSGNQQSDWRAYILWDDIQKAFPSATRLQCGKRVISFMIDGNGNRLHPLKIEYQPGNVIQVIVESRVSSLPNLSINGATSVAHSIRSVQSQSQKSQSEKTGASYTQSYKVPSIFVSWNGPDRHKKRNSVASINPSITLSASDGPTSRFRTSFYLYEAFLQSIHDGKADHVELIMNGLNEGRFSRADAHFPEAVQDLELQEAEVTTMQSRIQTILSTPYEWYNSPFPRLFIVLPKESMFNNNNNNKQSQFQTNNNGNEPSWDLGDLTKFCGNFRLHFLCECGNHSRHNQGSNKPHHIHLTKHQGFDLDNPIEFFRRFGHYILRMLQMIKYGVSVDGYEVPELSRINSNSHRIGGRHSLSDDASVSTMEPGVNLTIEFLNYLGSIGHLLGPQLQQPLSQDNSKPKDESEALGGADLRRLVVFLRGVQSNKALGNFYRIMNEEGHVHWVCRDHFHDSYDHLLKKELTDMMAASKSIFDERLGYVEVALKSSTVATQFYKVMERSKFIQELRIRFKWETSMSDFKALRDAIKSSKVTRLELTCSGSGSSAASLLSRGKKSDPLWQMIQQSKLQSFVMSGYTGFFSRVSIPAKTNTLQVLKITERLDWKKEHGKIVEWLENSPHLRELLLSCTDIPEAYKTIRKLNYETCSLTQLILDGGDTNGVQAWFERGVPMAMDLVVSSLSDPLLKEARVLRALHIRPGLHVPSEVDTDLLTGVISKNSNLAKLIIQCGATQFLQLHIAVREALNNDEYSKLNTLRLYGGCNQLTIMNIQGNALVELELMTMNAPPLVMESILRVYGNRLTKLKVEGNILKSLFDMAFQRIPLLLKHVEVVGSRVTPNMCYELRKIVESAGETLRCLSIQLDKPYVDSVQSDELANLVADLGPKWSKISIPELDRESWLKALANRGFVVPQKILVKLNVFRLSEVVHQGYWELGGDRADEKLERGFLRRTTSNQK